MHRMPWSVTSTPAIVLETENSLAAPLDEGAMGWRKRKGEDDVKTTRKLWLVQIAGVAALTIVFLGGAAAAQAQDREGRWELSLGTFYQMGADVDVKQGSPIKTDDSFGLEVGAGYNFSDMLATSFGLQWAGVDYNTNVIDDNGDTSRLSGTYDSFTVYGNLVLNLSDGPWVPYIGAGIGWTWIDTNIPSGPPSGVCWWDPWWGWVCYGGYPTKTTDSFSYQAFLGLRYEFPNNSTFLRFAYTSQWMDFSKASGSPRFDVISFDFGWIF